MAGRHILFPACLKEGGRRSSACEGLASPGLDPQRDPKEHTRKEHNVKQKILNTTKSGERNHGRRANVYIWVALVSPFSCFSKKGSHHFHFKLSPATYAEHSKAEDPSPRQWTKLKDSLGDETFIQKAGKDHMVALLLSRRPNLETHQWRLNSDCACHANCQDPAKILTVVSEVSSKGYLF